MLEQLKERILQALDWTQEDLETIQYADDSVLHDPMLYTNMDTLVTELDKLAQEQQTNPNALIIVDTDYDTDGIMSACVLHAALSLFGIRHKIYIPQMADGYGLNANAVMQINQQWGTWDIQAILTADNGTNAFSGVQTAKELGWKVLVTDHHLGGTDLAPADVIVNPNQPLDEYPFKGNAGATVAWKAMQAYANKFRPELLDFINELIVFAGIANISDVMPIIDENHYMARRTVEFTRNCQQQNTSHLPKTGARGFDQVFQALFDFINTYQTLRNEDRVAQGKKPSMLPQDEQLVSWYLSPLLNAPRRIIGAPDAAFRIFLSPQKEDRIEAIKQCYKLNQEKSAERDAVLRHIPPTILGRYSNVVFANTKSGISGLIAGQLANQTNHPSIVFSLESNHPDKVYGFPLLKEGVELSGSARSTNLPLPLIIQRIQELDPSIIVGGGGHANAAGYRIKGDKLKSFAVYFDTIAEQLYQELTPIDEPTLIRNHARLAFGPGVSTPDYVWIDLELVSIHDLLEFLQFQETLKPFGHEFPAQTTFELYASPFDFLRYDYDPNFWKTFKVKTPNFELLTFDTKVSNRVKELLLEEDRTPKVFDVELTLNEFRGKITPQLRITNIHA